MVSKEANIRLGNNIKVLRKVWGERQEDLAYAIGLTCESSNNSRLSNYEHGIRYPDPEIITKIAKHYRITEQELMYRDLTVSGILSLTKEPSKESIQQSLEVLFPLTVTDDALKNKNFSKAYEIQKELYKCFVEKNDFNENNYDVCCELYKKAFEEGILEAAANHLSLVILLGCSLYILTPELCGNIEYLDVKICNLKDLVRYGFLPSFTDNTEDEYKEIDDVRNDYVCCNNKIILTYINKLKYSKVYQSLGDYFLALRQMLGLVNNSLTLENNYTIGYEMLRAFSSIGNKYARNFFEIEKNS